MSARTLTPERIAEWCAWKSAERAARVERDRIARAATAGRATVLLPLELARLAGLDAEHLVRSRRRGYRRARVDIARAWDAADLVLATTTARRPR